MLEEPGFEEPGFEKPRPEEPMPQEPLPLEPKPQQPQPHTAPSNSSSGSSWATDFAITDIYPDKMPYGQFLFSITNHGPKMAKNAQVPVACNAVATNYSNGSESSTGTGSMQIKVNLSTSQTKEYATGLSLNTRNFWCQVTCQIQETRLDSNPGNNQYSETVPPPP